LVVGVAQGGQHSELVVAGLDGFNGDGGGVHREVL
jgi:hypothetical protein